MDTHSERLACGEWYLDGPELQARRRDCWRLLDTFNGARADEDEVRRDALIAMLGAVGEGATVVPRFQCTYGTNIRLGERAFVNANAFLMDDAAITLGPDVRLGPGAQLMTALHPVEDHARRRDGWEQALPISIGENTWLGASVTVGAGVTIGRNTVIGAGSVVLRDIPDHVVAVGSPATVIRQLPAEGGAA
ncbi:sugar O-acetyltransferase [Brachybacterium tyrofermentans]|uniref:Sugar O-acetyltransferase n=1 Tax=Brachybacterium tyrofermentans TaxID=47848 RepID=A0ABW0FFM9_9MICO